MPYPVRSGLAVTFFVFNGELACYCTGSPCVLGPGSTSTVAIDSFSSVGPATVWLQMEGYKNRLELGQDPFERGVIILVFVECLGTFHGKVL